MPNTKNGTISKDIVSTMNQMVGGTQYREKIGTIRAAIGQLRFTPEQLEANIQAFMGQLKKDVGNISETTPKQIHEVVSLGYWTLL
jgi:large subunit ribosomal protein L1